MLERICIDNYKCLVSFEYRPGKLQLIIGRNGTGKSTVFEVLALLRRFLVEGESAERLFPPSSWTRGQNRSRQTFEFDWVAGTTHYTYQLGVEHLEGRPRLRVTHEELAHSGEPLFRTQELRTPGEPIAIFVPKRHIETWVDYLSDGGPVGEDAPSPRHSKCEARECQEAAARFLALASQQPTLDDCPPSLERGLGELARVPKAID